MAGGTLITGSGTRTNAAWSTDKGESRLSGVSIDNAHRALESAADKLAGNPASKLRVYNRHSPDRELVLKRKWIFGGGRRDDTAQVVRQLADKASRGLSPGAREQFMQSVDRVLYSGEGTARRAVNLKGGALRDLITDLNALKATDALRQPRQSESANVLASSILPAAVTKQEIKDAIDAYIAPGVSDSNQQSIIPPNTRESEINRLTFSGVQEQEEEDDRIAGGKLQQWEKDIVLEEGLQGLERKLENFDDQFSYQPFDLYSLQSAADQIADQHQALTEEIEAADDIDIAIEKFEQLGLVSDQVAELKQAIAEATTWLEDAKQLREKKLDALNHDARVLHEQYAEPDSAAHQFSDPHPVLADIEEGLAALQERLALREPDLNCVRRREAQSIQTDLKEQARSLLSFTTRADTLINAIDAQLPPNARLLRQFQPGTDPLQAVETPSLSAALDAARSRSKGLNELIELWEGEKDFVQTRQLSGDGVLRAAIDQHLRSLRAEKDKIDTVLGSIRTVAQPARTVSEPESIPVAKPESPAPLRKASEGETALRALISSGIDVRTSNTIDDARRRFDRAVTGIDQILKLAALEDVETNDEIRTLLLKRFDAPDWWVASFKRATSDLTRLYDQRINELVSPEAMLAQSRSEQERQSVDAEVLQLTGKLEQLAREHKENADLTDVTNGFMRAHQEATEAQAQLDKLDSALANDPSLQLTEQLEAIKRTLATARAQREELGNALLAENENDQQMFSVELEDGLRATDDLELTERDEALAELGARRENLVRDLENRVRAANERIWRETEEAESRRTAARQIQANLSNASATGPGEELTRLRSQRAEVNARADSVSAALDAYQAPRVSR